MRYLYSALLYCLLPFILLRMLLRSRRAPAYRRRLAERFGVLPVDPQRGERPAIWVHAVSVGEALAAAPIIESLLERYPDCRLVVTTTTPTGSERIQALFTDRVFHVYAPWDLPGAVGRFMKRVKPELLLILETELWPNMLHHCRRRGCRVVLANARMSARSAAGYQRFAGLSRVMLESVNMVACQSVADSERLLTLGLPASQLAVTGSIKFDLELDALLRSEAQALQSAWAVGGRSILVAASTHPGEDEQILAAFKQLRQRVDNCLLVLVPRHPERFDAVFDLCGEAGWRVLRRSEGRVPAADVDIVVGDTMGELLLLLSPASVAVIGGSLVEHGGHNVLEASAWGVPVVTGPHMFNFAEISDMLTEAGGMVQLEDPATLGACLIELFTDQQRREQMGAIGQQVVADNRGAKKRLLALIDAQLRAGRAN
ncbi:MAG: lipid IV(A) 3-deoxy-D-manno-octulosonic acid transferase [Halioglobus sp.]